VHRRRIRLQVRSLVPPIGFSTMTVFLRTVHDRAGHGVRKLIGFPDDW
jgi:hypothetical protein